MKSNGKRDHRSNDLLSRYLQEVSLPLAQAGDLDQLIDRIGDARFVLLGEASHGTADYYTWRVRITARLIRERASPDRRGGRVAGLLYR